MTDIREFYKNDVRFLRAVLTARCAAVRKLRHSQLAMIVSWNWLKEYVPLDMPPAELERRLMMAGLNHEETQRRSATIWPSTWK